ncbi:MAG: PQQ-dependent sugar dehydrogenase, partial [Candidatus Methylomirabilis sp.]|nr:PQQ-dependent sugar dehydrogenase [Deltaproteobacteria bacterium]
VYVYYTQAAGPPVVVTPDWRSIQDNVFSTSCASCHAGPTPPAGLSLVESASFAALFEVPSTQAPGLQRVDAGDPDDSYLVRKIESAPGIVGQAMPPTGALLPAATRQAIRDWIAAGAPYNPGDPSNPPQAFRNRIARLTDAGGVGVDFTVILDDIAAGTVHNGGPLEFAPDGTLIVQVGDTGGSGVLAQNLGSLSGKILRINPDGSVPANNPFVGVPGAREEVLSLGHRNGFGVAPDRIAVTSPPRVYVSENGVISNDELNLSMAGLNYGWPTHAGVVGQPGFVDPLFTWTPVVAPTGVEQYTGGVYPTEYEGNLFLGQFNLRDVNPNPFVNDYATILNRFILTPDGGAVASREDLLVAFFSQGRYHPIDVIQGPDGLVYFTLVNTSSDLLGTIWRLDWVDADYDGCEDADDPAPGVA